MNYHRFSSVLRHWQQVFLKITDAHPLNSIVGAGLIKNKSTVIWIDVSLFLLHDAHCSGRRNERVGRT